MDNWSDGASELLRSDRMEANGEVSRKFELVLMMPANQNGKSEASVRKWWMESNEAKR